MDDDDVLEEQRRYYRGRAPEYDDWWQRRGRYDRGDAGAVREWEREVAVVEYLPDLHLRELADGSQFRVVKVMYEPDGLAALAEAEGWRTHFDATRRFIFGSAQPR